MELKSIMEENIPRDEQATTERAHDEEYNYQYYEEFKRLYQTAFLLSIQMKQLAQSKEEIWTKLKRIDKKDEDFKDDIRGDPTDKKKRFRRTAEEIERPFVCDVHKCHKCYGSEGSLQQHIKLKHPELYQAKLENGDFAEEANE